MTGATTVGTIRMVLSRLILAGFLTANSASAARAQPVLPDTIAVPNAAILMTVHAVGAQVYECAADTAGKPKWEFREPIATLLIDGRTVGRHFAGPTWQLADGSVVVAKVAARAPGATSNDIPWLKLDVTAGQGTGQLATATVVQRINTAGGVLAGACDHPGVLTAVPYASDYVFLTKGG